MPLLARDAHKGVAGRVLCLAGSETMPGAAILCARAAQRGGAGLVAVGCLDENPLRALPVACPEAILIDLREAYTGGWPEALAAFRAHAVVLGPGLGATTRTRRLLEAAIDALDVPLVVDADGLNVCAGEPELLGRARGPLVITPHPGEAHRLGLSLDATTEVRSRAARELARRVGGIVCLKGAGTVVATSEEAHVNPTGNPGLATAGSGDVLAGLMTAYLARTGAERTPLEAVRAAVYVHGLAGDLAAEVQGEPGVIASDVVDALGRAQERMRSDGS